MRFFDEPEAIPRGLLHRRAASEQAFGRANGRSKTSPAKPRRGVDCLLEQHPKTHTNAEKKGIARQAPQSQNSGSCLAVWQAATNRRRTGSAEDATKPKRQPTAGAPHFPPTLCRWPRRLFESHKRRNRSCAEPRLAAKRRPRTWGTCDLSRRCPFGWNRRSWL